MKVLAIDVGGTSVKILATGQKEARTFPSGPDMDPRTMVQQVKKLAADWQYDVVSIGIPAPFLLSHHDMLLANLIAQAEALAFGKTPRSGESRENPGLAGAASRFRRQSAVECDSG